MLGDAQRAAAAAQRRAAERALPGQALYQAIRANPALRVAEHCGATPAPREGRLPQDGAPGARGVQIEP
jgi:hypothetical protein